MSNVSTFGSPARSLSVKIDLVRIGNSQGIRIPKPLLEQCGFSGQIKAEVKGRTLVLTPAGKARTGWDEAFAGMAAAGDDVLLNAETPTGFDEAEWTW